MRTPKNNKTDAKLSRHPTENQINKPAWRNQRSSSHKEQETTRRFNRTNCLIEVKDTQEFTQEYGHYARGQLDYNVITKVLWRFPAGSQDSPPESMKFRGLDIGHAQQERTRLDKIILRDSSTVQEREGRIIFDNIIAQEQQMTIVFGASDTLYKSPWESVTLSCQLLMYIMKNSTVVQEQQIRIFTFHEL